MILETIEELILETWLSSIPWSFNTAGLDPVLSTISAAPLTVWAASFSASFLAKPTRTPAIETRECC
jgi:hypothetical protein